jgi:hypothetical protein
MSDAEKIIDALKFFGFDTDTDIDVCEDGSVYVGLTQILPPGSITPRND